MPSDGGSGDNGAGYGGGGSGGNGGRSDGFGGGRASGYAGHGSTGNYSGAATGFGADGYGPVSAGKPGVYGGGVWGGRAATDAEIAADRRARVSKQISDAKKTQGIIDPNDIPSMSMEERATAKGILSGMLQTNTNFKAINTAYNSLTKDMSLPEKWGFTRGLYSESMPNGLKAGLAIAKMPTGLGVVAASLGAALTGNLVADPNARDEGERESGVSSMPNSLSNKDLQGIAENAAKKEPNTGIPSSLLRQVEYLRNL